MDFGIVGVENCGKNPSKKLNGGSVLFFEFCVLFFEFSPPLAGYCCIFK